MADKPTYAPLPVRALADDRFSGRHYRALGIIAAHDRLGRNGTGCWAGRKRLAQLIGTPETRLSGTITDLCAWGYINSDKHPMDSRKKVLRVIYSDDDERIMKGKNRSPNGHLSGHGIGDQMVTENTEIGNIPDSQAIDDKGELERNILGETYKNISGEAGFSFDEFERDPAEAASSLRSDDLPAGKWTDADAAKHISSVEGVPAAFLQAEKPAIEQIVMDMGLCRETRNRAAELLAKIYHAEDEAKRSATTPGGAGR
jgi:hypothetical protein